MSTAVNKRWPIVSYDVSTAFLQGMEVAEMNGNHRKRMMKNGAPRRVFFDMPPQPACSYETLYDLDPQQFCVLSKEFADDLCSEATKIVYGLGDAPLVWRYSLHKTMTEPKGLGAEQSRHCECTYYVRCKATHKLIAMFTVHVDDLELCGEELVLRKIKRHLEGKYGTIKEQRRSILHCGIQYHKSLNNDCCTMDQSKFIFGLPYAQAVQRKVPGDALLGPAAHKEYRSGTGGVGWTGKTRVDSMIDVSMLQPTAASPNYEDIRPLNAVIR